MLKYLSVLVYAKYQLFIEVEVASGGIASAREGVSLPLSPGGITAGLSKSHPSTSLSRTLDWPSTLDELLNVFLSLLPEFFVLAYFNILYQYFPPKRANLIQSRVQHRKPLNPGPTGLTWFGFGNKRRYIIISV